MNSLVLDNELLLDADPDSLESLVSQSQQRELHCHKEKKHATHRTKVVALLLSLSGVGILYRHSSSLWPMFSQPASASVTDSEGLHSERHHSKPKPHCVESGVDCSEAGCCSAPGHQCFVKNAGWASCRPDCMQAPDPTDPEDHTPWNCTAVGPKTPGTPDALWSPASPPSWVQQRCSGSGQNCNETKCCKDSGNTCFTKSASHGKDLGWSMCKAACIPGPDPTDSGDNHPWQCAPLGWRTPGSAKQAWAVAAPWVKTKCSATYKNCMDTMCCKEAGHQCYQKDHKFAMCLPKGSCIHGPVLQNSDAGIWNCSSLGGPTPGTAPALETQALPEWVEKTCSKPGKNCTDSMCCANRTFQCYEQDSKWSGCMQQCTPGKQPDDDSGKTWSCQKRGPRTPRQWGKPSLYCYSVIRVNNYGESETLKMQARTDGGVGIFACDLYDVFASDGYAELGNGPYGSVHTKHFEPAVVTQSVDHTAGNTQLFMNVWASVKAENKWSRTDWTIKVDPDAVIMPEKLRWHLGDKAGGIAGAFIKTCSKFDMMYGAVEAVSRLALEKYFLGGGMTSCQRNYNFGEDRWLQECLASLGVQAMADFGMVGDNLCQGANCGDGKAAYHPFKDPNSWIGCYNQAKR